jgi:hypothetical protein
LPAGASTGPLALIDVDLLGLAGRYLGDVQRVRDRVAGSLLTVRPDPGLLLGATAAPPESWVHTSFSFSHSGSRPHGPILGCDFIYPI